MPELDKHNMGGTMRLGSRKTIFQPDSEWAKIRALYDGAQEIEERHRHRYEINPEYIGKLEAAGLHFVGKDETGQRMEIFEIKDHPYFVGTQFHAEYQSKVLSPSVSSAKVPASESSLTDLCYRAPTSASLPPVLAASIKS